MGKKLVRGLRVSCALALAVQAGVASATNLYWDSNGQTPDVTSPATGAWDGVALNFNTDPTGGAAGALVAATTSADDLFFSAGVGAIDPYIVTLTGAQSARGVTVQSAGALTLSGGTLGLSAGGLTINSGAGLTTIGSLTTIAANQVWSNASTNLLLASGAMSLDNQLTISGAGNTTISGVISGAGSINVNAGAAATINFSNIGNNFLGGVTLTSGVVDMGSNNVAFGAGTLTFNGGTIKTTAGNRNVANAVVIDTGGLTFTGTQADNFNGLVTVQNNPTLTFSDTGGKTFTNTVTLNSNLTVAGAGISSDAFSGGFTVGGGVAGTNRTLTLNRGANSVTLTGTLTGSAANQTITLAGTGTNNKIGNITSGTDAPNIIINADPAAVFNFTNTAATYTGTITLTSGIADLNGNNVADFSSATVVLNGGTIRNSQGARTVTGNASLVFDTGGGTFASTGGAQATIFANTIPVTVQNNPTINFVNTVSTYQFQGVTNLNSNLTIAGTHTQSASFTGGLNLNGAMRTIAFNDVGATTISGAFTGTPGTLVIAGSGTGGVIGALTGTASAVQVNSTTGGTFTFNGASTYTGGTTISGGTVTLSASSAGGPPPTSGPFGTGTLTLAGGTLAADGTARTISNVTNVTGNFRFSAGAGNGLTFTNMNSISGGVTMTFAGANLILFDGDTALNGDIALAGTTAAGLAIRAGLTNAGTLNFGPTPGNRTVTINNTLSTGQVIRGAMNFPANTLTFAGTGETFFGSGSGPATGSTGGVIVGGAKVKFEASSTFTGGVILNSGVAQFNVSGTATAGVLISSPFGVGPLTLNGGVLRMTDTTARTILNSTIFSGDVTIGALTTNTGTITFDPTSITSPAAGSITVSGARTLTLLSNAGFTGPVTGASTPSLVVKGPGTLTLTNASATASTFGNVAIGDMQATGSIGGAVSAASQNALGAGSYTVNYGGSLTWTNATTGLSNALTVNNGGAYRVTAGAAGGTVFGNVTSASVFTSGSTYSQSSGQAMVANSGTSAAQATFPTAGAMFFAGANSTTFTGKYPDTTGTLAIGGVQTTGTPTFTLPTVVTAPRTLAFNTSGGGAFNLGGATLNANLTIAGGANASVAGVIPQGGVTLGPVTEDSTPRSLTIAMAPTGQVNMSATTAGFTGGLYINSGTLSVDGGNTVGVKAGGTITLGGGTIRNQNAANNNSTWQDAIVVGAGGGTYETFSAGNAQIVTLTGAITGSGPLALRYGGLTANTSSIVLAPTLTSTFNGPVNVTTTSGRGRVQFNANSLAGIGAGGVTVAPGALFGVDTYATLTANNAKFTTSTDSILALDALGGATFTGVDLSAAGINRDVRLGGTATFSGSPTLTPFASTYNFTPAGGNITVNSANLLTGATKNLDVRAGAIAPGVYGVATGSLIIQGAQDFGGTTVVAGTINSSLIGAGSTATTLQFGTGGDFSATSAITVERGASLILTGSGGKITAAAPLVVRSGATFRAGSGTASENNGMNTRLNPISSLTLGGPEGGGTFTAAFPAASNSASVTMSSLAVAAGASTINTTNTAAGTLAVNFGGADTSNYTRSAGGTVNISLPTATATPTAFGSNVATVTIPTGLTNVYVGMPISGTGLAAGTRVASYDSGTGALGLSQPSIAANAAAALTYVVNNATVNFTTAPASSAVVGGLLVGATINSNEFVSAAAGAVAPATYTTQPAAGLWGAGQNITDGGTAFSGTTTAGLSINSLRAIAMPGNGAFAIGTAAADNLTVATGMVMNNSANTLNINGPGSLLTGSGEYVFVNSKDITVAAKLNSAVPLTKTGSAILTLSNTGNQFTDMYLSGSSTVISAAGALPTTGTRIINLLGGGLRMSVGGTFGAGTSFNVGVGGGNIDVNAGAPVSFAGAITLNGALTLSAPSGGGATTTTFSGNLTGPGQVIIGKQADGKNVNVFTGNNSAWTGGVRFDNGNNSAAGNSHLRFSPAAAGFNSSGTGPINLVGGNSIGGIYFDTTAAGSTTFANDIVLNFSNAPIVAWGLNTGLGTAGTPNVTTLSGKITGSQGLFLQGYATGDGAVSELVLAGTVSPSGSASGYSYGSAAAAQNFNNGQGGITSGVTQFRTLTQQGTGNVPLVDLPSGQAVNGAEGFVRFAGVQSLIPGAVGPGYVSAIRKAGAGQDGRFGYLLTGSAGAGTAYTLPEGKSFVIGSLGAGAQHFGTLGVSDGKAILAGNPKAAPGQLLAGFGGGDVNIHANSVADAQSLNLLARGAGDTLQLGAAGAPLVFAPTTGDSGFTSSITLMSKRTGLTTLNKVGAGAADVTNAAFTHTDGTSARANFAWTVSGGTLNYNQADTGANFDSATVNASGTLVINGQMNTNSAVVNTGGVLKAAGTNQSLKAITVNTGGTAEVTSAALAVLTANSLAISGPTGHVDLHKNAMVVDYTGASPLGGVGGLQSKILSAYNGGAWTGKGIGSTEVATSVGSSKLLAVGYGEASDIFGPGGGLFDFGQGVTKTVDGTAILMRTTLAGDADLSGDVGLNDLLRLANHYGLTTTTGWYDGDFDYSGDIGLNDLLQLANNYGQALPSAPIPGAPANFQSDLELAFELAAAGQTSVPEPTSLGLAAIAGTALLAKRRRRNV